MLHRISKYYLFFILTIGCTTTYGTSDLYKIAVVDPDQLIQAPKLKNLLNTQNKKFTQKKTQLDKEGSELQMAVEELRRNEELLDKQSFETRQKQLTQQMTQFQKKHEAVEREAAQSSIRLIQWFAEISQIIGKKQGYTLIFLKTKEVLLYAAESLDISKEVIQHVEKGYVRLPNL